MNNSLPPTASDSLDASIPFHAEQQKGTTDSHVSLQGRLRRWWWHRLVRLITLLCLVALRIAGWIGRRPRTCDGTGLEILLTGRFDSANWILAHLGPLAASSNCSRLWMVSTNPVPSIPKVEGIYPPRWLMRIMGATPARLLIFSWTAMRKRPHVVGGFHLIVNGIIAAIVGRLTGAQSMYFCVGGPAEVLDGGVHSDDNPFARMETADAVVERRLIRIISEFDAVITMGTRAVTFFRDKEVDTAFHVVSGGIDPQRFHRIGAPPSVDVILTGRLVPIKRMDVFLRAVRCVVDRLPTISAVIVGDGRLREELQGMAKSLGVDRNVTFVGHQDKVEDWLRGARIFVLTSDSEGLSLSLMEAMMTGLPAVVSDVGDLADLVKDGVNGYLVPRRSPELFAGRLAELLSDPSRLAAFSRAASASAMCFETQVATCRWDDILAGFQGL